MNAIILAAGLGSRFKDITKKEHTGLVMVPFMEYQRGAWVWGLLVAGLVLVAGWVAWERRYAARGRAPMVDQIGRAHV